MTSNLATARRSQLIACVAVGALGISCGRTAHVEKPGATETSLVTLRDFPALWSATQKDGVTVLTVEPAKRPNELVVTATLTGSGAEAQFRRSIGTSAISASALASVDIRVRSGNAVAKLKMLAVDDNDRTAYEGVAETASVASAEWTTVTTTVDVDGLASRLMLSLEITGEGQVDFRDLRVTRSNGRSSSRRLSRREVDNIVATTRVINLVRYFHPSDQSAATDWNAFAPSAIEYVMGATNDEQVRDRLAASFSLIAPTARFYTGHRSPPVAIPAPAAGLHLTRWLHRGFRGSSSSLYWSERVGVDEYAGDAHDTNIFVTASRSIQLQRKHNCKRASVRLVGTLPIVSRGTALWMAVRRVDATVDEHIARTDDPVRANGLVAQIPDDAREISYGAKVSTGAFTLTPDSNIEISCENKVVDTLLSNGPAGIEMKSTAIGEFAVSAVNADRCERSQCVRIARAEASRIFDLHDVYDAALAGNVRVAMPTAVWTDGVATYPRQVSPSYRAESTVRDVYVRLAAVSLTWGAVRYFYPYLQDVEADWERVLREAIVDAAAVTSGQEMHRVLRAMVAPLRDAHASVRHPADDRSSVLPLKLRWLEGRLVVAGGSPPLVQTVGLGTEILAIDGVPATQALRDIRPQVSSSSPGWLDSIAVDRLTLGPRGEIRVITTPGVGERARRTIAVPLRPRSASDVPIREHRPATGSELRRGIYYVDLEGLTREQWAALLPTLAKATGVVFDLRGYVTRTSYLVLSAIAANPLDSPFWTVPMRHTPDDDSVAFDVTRWRIYPSEPRISARVVFLIDGRAASAAETVASIAHAYKLGTFIGEPTAGTNGNPSTIEVPGGFTVRFTAMRVLRHDKTLFHRTGIVPNVAVHPTVAGVTAGRDEQLETALEYLEKP